MNKNNLPIAVIDSGVGGISVLRELIKIMPNENYIYFGDSINAPYGSKGKREVLDITRKNLEALKEKGIKALVVACNTATSAAVRILREENPELVIVGIEPAIKPPADELDHPRVLVMATPLTLAEEKFFRLVERYAERETVIPLPCPRLAELIESGDLDSPELEKYTGDSFRDLTRIAKINDKMWSELFIMNKESLLKEMDSFIEEFTNFRNLIKDENTEILREKMRASTARRSLFDKPTIK